MIQAMTEKAKKSGYRTIIRPRITCRLHQGVRKSLVRKANGRATICTPIGKPSVLRPTGITLLGRPKPPEMPDQKSSSSCATVACPTCTMRSQRGWLYMRGTAGGSVSITFFRKSEDA